MNNFKLVSGGQAGITRGALDGALSLSVSCSGCFSTSSRESDDLPLDKLDGYDYREGVKKNVLDSDASAIIYFRLLEGCAEETLDDCVQHGKPYRLIDGDELQPGQAAKVLAEFLQDCGALSLNVVGPESLENAREYKYGQDTVRLLIEAIRRKSGGKRSGSKRSRQGDHSKTNGGNRSSQGKAPSSRRRNRKRGRAKHTELRSSAGSGMPTSDPISSPSSSPKVVVHHKTSKVTFSGKGDPN